MTGDFHLKLLFILLSLLFAAQAWAGTITSFFNQRESVRFQEPYRGIKRYGDNFEDVIINRIMAAKEQVWLAVQEFNLPRIAEALALKKRAGVDVRVIIENMYNHKYSQLSDAELANMDDYLKEKYAEFLLLADRNHDGFAEVREKEQADALYILEKAGVPLIDDTADGSLGSGLMHHKFLVIDSKELITGSANFTLSGFFGDFSHSKSRGNSNSILHINDAQVASYFAEEFLIMWGSPLAQNGGQYSRFGASKPYRGPKFFRLADGTSITVQFSPFSSTVPWHKTTNGLIAKVLNSAKKSILFALFVLSEQQFADVMKLRQAAGVNISGLIDAGFAYQYYSEALDMLGLERPSYSCSYERGNNIWETPLQYIGTSRHAVGDKLHHKYGVVDGRYTIVGSHNWSKSANLSNDETLVVIDSEKVAQDYTQEFKRLSRRATWGVPQKLKETIEAEIKKCQNVATFEDPFFKRI